MVPQSTPDSNSEPTASMIRVLIQISADRSRMPVTALLNRIRSRLRGRLVKYLMVPRLTSPAIAGAARIMAIMVPICSRFLGCHWLQR